MEKKNKGELASAKHEPLFLFCILLDCKELTEKHFPEAGGQAGDSAWKELQKML